MPESEESAKKPQASAGAAQADVASAFRAGLLGEHLKQEGATASAEVFAKWLSMLGVFHPAAPFHAALAGCRAAAKSVEGIADFSPATSAIDALDRWFGDPSEANAASLRRLARGVNVARFLASRGSEEHQLLQLTWCALEMVGEGAEVESRLRAAGRTLEGAWRWLEEAWVLHDAIRDALLPQAAPGGGLDGAAAIPPSPKAAVAPATCSVPGFVPVASSWVSGYCVKGIRVRHGLDSGDPSA